MKQITTDTFSFEALIKRGALYVDKTQYVWDLVSSASSVYFLARPRRFGKSLLLSTLEAFFLNKRELFKGLAIESLAPEEVWEQWPVIHLDMAQASSTLGLAEIQKSLDFYMGRVARNLGLAVESGRTASQTLQLLVDYLNAKTGKGVVILIDEYDKPILDALHTDYVDKVVGLMQSFYQVLKSNVGSERFVFITGVTKFAHTSLFSGFNNPTDITQRNDYATMLGYTEQELRDNFGEYIADAAKIFGVDSGRMVAMMKDWYDGFRFTPSSGHVFNPVSVGKFLTEKIFDNYWYATGTPTFLINQMKNNPFRMDRYTTRWYDMVEYGKSEASKLDPLDLAVQTGYLTIKDVKLDMGIRVRYGFPNREIQQSWYRNMLPLTYSDIDKLRDHRSDFWDSFQSGDVDTMMQQLKWMFSGVTKENIGEVNEGYYRNLLYMLLVAFGINAHAEEPVAGGRVDIVAEGVGQAYVMELKVSRTGDKANVEALLAKGLDQAQAKHYADKYRLDDNTIHVVSVVFEHKHNQLVAWRELK